MIGASSEGLIFEQLHIFEGELLLDIFYWNLLFLLIVVEKKLRTNKISFKQKEVLIKQVDFDKL